MLVTLVTHAAMPDGVEDDHLLAHALSEAGAKVLFAAWNDPGVDWSLTDLAVIRSTCDYHLNSDAWFEWLTALAARTPLVNSIDLVRWNS